MGKKKKARKNWPPLGAKFDELRDNEHLFSEMYGALTDPDVIGAGVSPLLWEDRYAEEGGFYGIEAMPLMKVEGRIVCVYIARPDDNLKVFVFDERGQEWMSRFMLAPDWNVLAPFFAETRGVDA